MPLLYNFDSNLTLTTPLELTKILQRIEDLPTNWRPNQNLNAYLQ